MVAASAVAELADALDAELAEKANTPLLAELELPLEYVLATWRPRASPSTTTCCPRSRRSSAPR